ncbi:hypothetical protein MSG28_007990 [Choristoneura fumiferana]|uniref:Uncharacterized protein n=1 Tax=Choristoneura fumiferana TaxID=7141 RepID=A0ACC0J9I9_CHOFU|nr:hypothetical protein MSG28_007990 [Choristoneura fumiferana]
MMADFTPFFVDRAKGGRASCKGCKGNCPSGELRMAKLVASPYGENQQMKSWHHIDCLMNALIKQRPTTKRIDSIDDIGNWATLNKEDQEFILKKINDMEKVYAEKNSGKYTAKVLKNESLPKVNIDAASSSKDLDKQLDIKTDDNNFSMFFKLCKKISKVDAYLEKTAVVNDYFRKGTDGSTFKGDLALWCKLLLPQVTKRVYNLKSKQLVKLFSRIFHTDIDDMLTHLEKGDIADTIHHFFTKSKKFQPVSESTLTIQEVEEFLEGLSKLTKEEEQIYHFKTIVRKCTSDDLKMIIRLIKGDLRINAGPKHILEGVHPNAYNVFQTSRDLNMVIDRILSESSGVKHKDFIQKGVSAKLTLMTPVLPMLAEACKSVEMAMKKCPNGMFSEIKYDGERVQVHKKDNEFKYFSRALKPVLPHKVSHFKDYLPQAFPKGVDMILDAEVLMVDVNTGKPLPFGTLGKHKQSEFKDAQVCLFVFDCLYYNGKVLIDLPIRKRRQIMYDNMVEVTNHVMFSEQQLIQKPADLAKMIAEVLQQGLEGLVLKDLESTYEPGKRHWLKVKKDYLFDGAMADTADLVVLGAWFGTEFTKANIHTADGISVRFPRVTKIRNDKDWKTATNLDELKHLYKTSKEKTDVTLLNKLAATANDSYEPPKKKLKENPKLTKIDSFLRKDKTSPKQKPKKKEDLSSSNSSDTISDNSFTIDEKVIKKIKFVTEPENPLPDIFKTKNLGFYPDFISIPEKERMRFERHWIAYGGTVVKSMSHMDVDYVVHNEDTIEFRKMKKLRKKLASNARHVTKDWLIKCINHVTLFDTAKHGVVVEP